MPLSSMRLDKPQNAFPFLIGMKYDHFTNFSMEEQEDITKQVRLY